VSLAEVRKPPALSTGQLQRIAYQAARQELALPCNHVNGFGGRLEKTIPDDDLDSVVRSSSGVFLSAIVEIENYHHSSRVLIR
jgi:hypothetical protein